MSSAKTLKLTPGKRVLFLTKDADIIRRQLRGELDLTMDDGEGTLLIAVTYVIKATNSRYNLVYPFLLTEAG